MRVKVLLQITDDDGAAGVAAEVAAFEKVTERPEDLGLSIAEAKALLAAVQQRTVDAQVACWMERHRCCEACGQHRRTKGNHRVVFPHALRRRGDHQSPTASLPVPEHGGRGDRVAAECPHARLCRP